MNKSEEEQKLEDEEQIRYLNEYSKNKQKKKSKHKKNAFIKSKSR